MWQRVTCTLDNWGTPLSLYVSSSDIPGIADVDGDGEVLEELVTARSTDYYYGDTVTLTPQAAEGSGFVFLGVEILEI